MTDPNNRYALNLEIKSLVENIEKLASSFIELHQNQYDIEHINVVLNSCFYNMLPVETNIIQSNIIYGTNYSFNFKNFYFSFKYLTVPKLNKISTNKFGEIIFICVPNYKNSLLYKAQKSFDYLFSTKLFTKNSNTKVSIFKYKSSLLNTRFLFFYSFNNLLILKRDLEELHHYLQLVHSLFFLFDLINGKQNLDSVASKSLFNSILNNPADFKIPFWAFLLHSSNNKSMVSILEYAFKSNPIFLDNLSLGYLEKIIALFQVKPSILKQNMTLYLTLVQKIKMYKDVEKSLHSSTIHHCTSTRIKSKKVQKI